MNKHFKNALSLTCILLVGCTQSASRIKGGDQPDWLIGEPASYPNSSYVSATGSASKAELAKDRALGNLAKIFELQVRETPGPDAFDWLIYRAEHLPSFP